MGSSLLGRGGSPRPNRLKSQQQQQQHRQQQSDFEGDQSSSLACCFFVDMNEKKKKTPSCKKLGDAFEAGKKKKMTIADKGNVKSASLPSINAEDSTFERAEGESTNDDQQSRPTTSTNDESVAKRGAKNDSAERSGATGATAWEIPSGKAKKKQQ